MMPANNGMMQNFLRMAGLFGPQDDTDAYAGMPPELPTARGTPPLVNRQGPSISAPGAYGPEPKQGYNPLASGVEPDSNDTLNAFRQNVLNPPQRQHMTYPKNTLAGLDAAFKIAAEPSEASKNRVMVDGVAHQKQKVLTDPVTGKKRYITDVQEPSFMENVMRAMPAAISPAVDILNQPHEDAMTDWDLKNKGLSAAASAESAMALAGQRRAAADAVPRKLEQADRALDIKTMDAQTRERLALLKDLPESEKLRLIQEGKITAEELKAAAQYTLQELRGAQRTDQIGQQGRIRTDQINQQGNITSGHINQRGAITSDQIDQRGAITSGHIAQRGAIQKESVAQRGGIQAELARLRGEESRKTKGTPGAAGSGGAGSSEYQQKVGLQNRTAQVLAQNPEWEDHVTFDENGFPEIEPPGGWSGPDQATYDAMYQSIYGAPRTTAIPPRTNKAPAAAPAPRVPNPPAPRAPVAAPVAATTAAAAAGPPIKQYSPSRDQTRISTDGGKTWKTVKGKA